MHAATRFSIVAHRVRAALLATLLAILLLPAARAAPPPLDPGGPVVRIGLRSAATSAQVAGGPLRVWRVGSGLRGTAFPAGTSLEIRPAVLPASAAAGGTRAGSAGWGLALRAGARGDLGVFAEPLLFEPLAADVPLSVGGRPYRGEVLVSVSGAGRLTVINVLRIEDYLRGVVPEEIGSSGVAFAALEAQAVAARSYTLHYRGRRAADGFDLLAGPEDQVYGGVASEREAASRAVTATRGVVAVYEGAPIRANYCSTCGGATEAAERVWPGEDIPYLRAVRDAPRSGRPYCAASRFFRWEESWSCDQLRAIIAEQLPRLVPAAGGGELGRLKGLRAVKRSPSGRVELLEVQMEGGNYRVAGDRARSLLRRADGSPLRSTWIAELQVDRDHGCVVTLQGGGYGHGVGMCQYGAMELARQGLSAAQILRHYYRGVTLEQWW